MKAHYIKHFSPGVNIAILHSCFDASPEHRKQFLSNGYTTNETSNLMLFSSGRNIFSRNQGNQKTRKNYYQELFSPGYCLNQSGSTSNTTVSCPYTI